MRLDKIARENFPCGFGIFLHAHERIRESLHGLLLEIGVDKIRASVAVDIAVNRAVFEFGFVIVEFRDFKMLIGFDIRCRRMLGTHAHVHHEILPAVRQGTDQDRHEKNRKGEHPKKRRAVT